MQLYRAIDTNLSVSSSRAHWNSLLSVLMESAGKSGQMELAWKMLTYLSALLQDQMEAGRMFSLCV